MSNSHVVRKYLDELLEENARYEHFVSDQEEYEYAMYWERRLGHMYPAWECIHGPPKSSSSKADLKKKAGKPV